MVKLAAPSMRKNDDRKSRAVNRRWLLLAAWTACCLPSMPSAAEQNTREEEKKKKERKKGPKWRGHIMSWAMKAAQVCICDMGLVASWDFRLSADDI